MKAAKITLALCAATLSADVLAASTGPIEAFTVSTIRPDGPRLFNGELSELFFNVEGVNNGDFANYGVARFDLGGLDLSGATIDSVELDLYESNAGFTTNGNVAVYFSDDDSSNIGAGSSFAYVADGNTPFSNDFTDTVFLGGDFFEETGNGDLESFNVAQNLQVFADDDGIITLVFAEFNDGDVAATYAGLENTAGPGPTLTINYTVSAVPVPAAVWLMGSGLVALAGVARRRS